MIYKIARKEFVEMQRDGRFRWSALVVLALLCAALALGWKNYTTAKTEQARAQNESRESWENQGERNPHSAAHFGVYAFKPKMPLSFGDGDFIVFGVWKAETGKLLNGSLIVTLRPFTKLNSEFLWLKSSLKSRNGNENCSRRIFSATARFINSTASMRCVRFSITTRSAEVSA